MLNQHLSQMNSFPESKDNSMAISLLLPKVVSLKLTSWSSRRKVFSKILKNSNFVDQLQILRLDLKVKYKRGHFHKRSFSQKLRQSQHLLTSEKNLNSAYQKRLMNQTMKIAKNPNPTNQKRTGLLTLWDRYKISKQG